MISDSLLKLICLNICFFLLLQFGGKLITFEHNKASTQQQQQPQPPQRLVQISQVVTETELVARSDQLQSALSSGQLAEFCAMKVANSKSEVDENVWNFLKVRFSL